MCRVSPHIILALYSCLLGPQEQVQSLLYTNSCCVLEGSTPERPAMAFSCLQGLSHVVLIALLWEKKNYCCFHFTEGEIGSERIALSTVIWNFNVHPFQLCPFPTKGSVTLILHMAIRVAFDFSSLCQDER